MNKKSQSTLEFIILLIAVLTVMVVLIAFMKSLMLEKNKERINLAFINVVSQIKNEIELASTSSEGYRREFDVPERVLGVDYTLTITESFLVVTTEDQAYYTSQQIPKVTGSIQKGTNVIRKELGIVYLNL